MELSGREFDGCPECSGVWIPGSAVDGVLGRGELLKLRSLCSVRQSSLCCPVDGVALGEGRIGPVTVDLCFRCNGLWLDHGELESLLGRKPIAPHRSLGPEGTIDTLKPDYSGAELLLYTLIGLS